MTTDELMAHIGERTQSRGMRIATLYRIAEALETTMWDLLPHDDA